MPLSIQDLPNELIGSIFKAGAEIENKWDYPLYISCINRLFRDVARSTPGLWSRIIVEDSRPAGQLSLWITRSKSCLLDISISFMLRHDASQVLAESCTRWRTLQVTGENLERVRATLAPYIRGPFPQLESVQLHSRSPLYREWNNHHHFFFVNVGLASHPHSNLFTDDLPSLTRLRLTRICIGCTTQILSSQCLTHLTVSHFSPSYELLTSLFAQSRLSTLVLDAFCITDPMPPGKRLIKSIDASSLTTLAVHFTDGHTSSNDCPCCLSWLSMPNLQNLELAHIYDRPELCRHFYIDSRTNYPHVQTIKLALTSISAEFCTAFPNVVDIHLDHLDNGGVPSTVTQEGVWPKLKTVYVDCSSEDWQFRLSGWIRSRRETGHPLELVHITREMWKEATHDGESPRELDDLRVLVGVEIFDTEDWFLLRWAKSQNFDMASEDSWESEDEDEWSDYDIDHFSEEEEALWGAYEDDSFDAEEDGEFEEQEEVEGYDS